MQIYLVGGAVRDALLGLPVYDQDWVVVGATPKEMLRQGFNQVGKDFPVFLHPKTKQEYALARTERKKGQGYHGFEMDFDASVTLTQDLARRDLTINAIAQAADGTLIDPYGGLADIENRVLRHVSPAFVEDPLRVLRVARFAAKLAPLGFKLACETTALLTQIAQSGELAYLTPERVWQEVAKALSCPKPSVFFAVLSQVQALPVLFAELAQLQGVPQSPKHHPEGDAYVHSLMVLDAASQLSNSLNVRFAALVHDLGKGTTPSELWPAHKGHEQAGLVLLNAFSARFRLPNKLVAFAQKVMIYHGKIHQGGAQSDLTPADYLQVLKGCGALKEVAGFAEILLACEADSKGRLGFEQQPYPQRAFWLALCEQVNQLDNQAILAQGYKGAEIGAAIEQQQLKLIAAFLEQAAKS